MIGSILCLDCGFCATGVAIIYDGKVEHCEAIRTKPDPKRQKLRRIDEDCERIAELVRGLKQLIDKHEPIAIIVEFPHGGAKSSRAARTMGMATSMVVTISEMLKLPLITVTPEDVKKITGNRRASKEEVEAVVLKKHPEARKLLPKVKAKREHCSDAIGAWIAGQNDPTIRMLDRIG